MRARRYAYSFFDDDPPRKEAIAGSGFLSDNLGAAETLTKSVTQAPIGEALGLTENVSNQFIAAHFGTRFRFSYQLFDDEPRIEAISRVSFDGSIADTLGLTETLDAQVDAAPIVENFDLNENLAASVVKNKTVSDAIGFGESLTALALIKGRSDSRRFAYLFFDDEPRIERPATTALYSQPAADSIVFSEALQRSVAQALAESAGLSEADAAAIARQLSESLSFSEALAASKISNPTLGVFEETLGAAESLARRVERAIAESIGLTEAQARAVGKLTADNLIADETLARYLTRTVNEPALTLVEALHSAVARQLGAETIGLAETLQAVTVAEAVAESVGLTESQARAIIRRAADSLIFDEALKRDLARTVAEAATLSEALNAVITHSLDAEAVTLNELFSAMLIRMGELSDTSNFTEALDPQRIVQAGRFKLTELGAAYRFDEKFVPYIFAEFARAA